MKKAILCVFILLVSVNAFAAQAEISQLAAKAENGDAEAQFNLGICYDNGKDVPQDNKQAVYWYQKAAEQGYAAAQNSLGFCYWHGLGVEQDYNQAAYWWQKAAAQGFAKAQTALGFCYAFGHGVTQNYERAIYWYHEAANQGEVAAQNILSLCYYFGEVVPADYKLAYMWLTIALDNAADHELQGAWREMLAELKLLMTDAEIAEARQMAAEWQESHQ